MHHGQHPLATADDLIAGKVYLAVTHDILWKKQTRMIQNNVKMLHSITVDQNERVERANTS